MMNTTHAIGWKAKDFALQGIDGRTYSLAEIRGPKGTLVIFICNHCPYVKASLNRNPEAAECASAKPSASGPAMQTMRLAESDCQI